MNAYARPATLPEAIRILSGGAHRVLAGGTDLYPGAGAALTGDVLDIGGIAGLRGITVQEGGLRIGACTTWAAIAAAHLPPALAALQQAAAEVGGVQIQNMGTLGGNLCNASPAADGVPPLLAVGAEVELSGAGGVRRMALADFITGPRRTGRQPGELLTAILVSQGGMSGRSRFLKLGARRHLVISIAMVAVRVVVAEGRIAEAALAVGSCSAVARRLGGLEAALRGLPCAAASGLIDDATVAAALAPLDDLRATAAYRAAAAAELLRRAVAEVAA